VNEDIGFEQNEAIVKLKALWEAGWQHFVEQKIPGKVVHYNVRGTQPVITVQLGVSVYRPTGRNSDLVLCPRGTYQRGDYVSLQLDKAQTSVSEMTGAIVERYKTQPDFEQAVSRFRLDHAAWISLLDAGQLLSDPLQAVERELRARSLLLQDNQRALELREQELLASRKQLEQDREQANAMASRAASVLTREKALETDLREFERAGGKAVVNLLKPITKSVRRPRPDTKEISVTDIYRHFVDSSTSLGFRCEGTTALQFVSSLCASIRTGQFIVLTGPTGIGKTSLVTHAARIFDCGAGVVPVRPAWIDSSDLVGFFDTRTQRFHPTPFLDCLVDAKEECLPNHLYLLTLDEMNLGRVENYAGDLLSRFEKSVAGDGVIQLYSRELRDSLLETVSEIPLVTGANSDHELSPETAAKLRLREHLRRYPPEYKLPQGLCIFGTLNIDETTYAPSPKFLDRSFVLRVPPPPLDAVLTQLTSTGPFEPRMLTLNNIRSVTCDEKNRHFVAINKALRANTDQLTELELHVGYRTIQAAKAMSSFTTLWSGVSESEVVDTFFVTKILPKLSFHEDDRSPTGSYKKDVLDQWVQADSIAPFSQLKTALKRISSVGGPVIRYLGE
jgi:energy-coupling factor transporter ATP-binding protein EcfA2